MKQFLLFAWLLFSQQISAQEVRKIHEIGVEFTANDQYGLTYRFGNEKALWRVRASTCYGLDNQFNGTTLKYSNSYDQLHIGFGREYRKSVADHTTLRWGMDLTCSAWNVVNKTNYFYFEPTEKVYVRSFGYQPGLNLIAGLSYRVNRLVLGLEILPSVSYQWNFFKAHRNDLPEQNEGYHLLLYRLDGSSALISAVYQF